MTFEYNKINAKCMWCKRTKNPHPDFLKETIPTKIFESKKGRKIELCFSCFEQEKENSANWRRKMCYISVKVRDGNITH